MLLVAMSLALLVVYAGIKLLIQTKKEILSNSFRYVAWFFIISGFLILACASICCIAMCCKYGNHMMNKDHQMMMSENRYGRQDMAGDNYHHQKKRKHYHQMPDGCIIKSKHCDDHGDKCYIMMDREVCKGDSSAKKTK